MFSTSCSDNRQEVLTVISLCPRRSLLLLALCEPIHDSRTTGEAGRRGEARKKYRTTMTVNRCFVNELDRKPLGVKLQIESFETNVVAVWDVTQPCWVESRIRNKTTNTTAELEQSEDSFTVLNESFAWHRKEKNSDEKHTYLSLLKKHPLHY